MEILKQAARLVGFKNRQYETLTEINAAGFKIRIWRQAKSIEAAQGFDRAALQAQMQEVVSLLPQKTGWLLSCASPMSLASPS